MRHSWSFKELNKNTNAQYKHSTNLQQHEQQIDDLKEEILRLELKNEVLTEDLRLIRLKLNEGK